MDPNETYIERAGSNGSDKLNTLARLITEVEHFSDSERLTAIALMENFLKKQPDVDQSSDPSDPVDSTKDTIGSNADPLQEDIQNRRSQTVSVDNSHQSTSGDSEKTNVNHVTFTVSQNVTIPIDYENNIEIHEHPPIEWVRDKAGISWNIDSQNGDTLIGHRPGLRGSQEIRLEDCADIHYKKKTEEMEA